MAPSLLSLSILAASLAGALAEPSDNGYIGNNGHWTPKFAATAWKAGRRGSDNNGVHVFFTGSNGCSGIQLATLSTDLDGHGNNHHGRANPGLGNQGNNVQQQQQQQQQQGGNNQNQQNRGGAQNQNQNQNNQNSQNQQPQQQDNRNQNQNNQNGQVQENTFSISETQNNRGGNNNNVNVNTANVNNFNSQASFWTKGYCFSNSGHNSWRINTDAAFAVTSIGGSNDVADMRLFYWSATGRGNTAVLKDAYYTRSWRGKRGSNQNENNFDSGRWKSGKLSKTVSRAKLGSLAATSWTKDGKVGRTVFYIQGGYLRELTLDECDDGHGPHGHGDSWDDEDRDGVELHFNPGEMSAVSWFDDKGILHKRVYVRNTDTNQVIEYTWSDATPYTTVNNLYATSFIRTGAGSSAASLQVSRGKPNLYLWTVGPQGGAVKEDDDRHGKNAKAGTQLAAATAQGSGGASYVFFLNKDRRLTQSNRDGEGKWHENVLVKMQNGH